MKKIIFDAIYKHLCDHSLITPNQSGFRPGDSTINQLLSITHSIYTAFEEVPSRETRAVFLDLSKAFDRVWHKGLLYKLKCNGISGSLFKVIQDFLHDRKQRVLLNGKCSNWSTVKAGVPQGSVLGPLFFLLYINDLPNNVSCEVKLFADDTSLFSVVKDEYVTSLALNLDLEKIRIWAWQWKMLFNADKTEEIIFSWKRAKSSHPVLKLGNDEIKTSSEHKHLGIILDSKLDFQSHIREAILKARRGIGLIRYLSKFVSRDVLDQMYKLYVRPHLDYGDIIYHRFDPEMHLEITKRLEQVQYSAALAVTGTWRGTSRQRLYQELGWETLYHRRWYRRLTHFFSLKKSESPEYLFNEIPKERQLRYDLRNPNIYEQPVARTTRFANTYFQNALFEWNLLDSEIQNSASISQFKAKLLSIIRPVKNPIYRISDILGVRLLTRLRVQFSALNEHRFRHAFDCLTPICICGLSKESNEHFLLHCPQHHAYRMDLFGQLSEIPGIGFASLDDESRCNILLYGSPNCTIMENTIILESTITFIQGTGRFN